MRQFYCTFPIRDTLCPELSWSHYRVLMRINDEQARRFYMEECAKAAWSVRQLERQINTMYYQRILASRDKIAVANEIQTTEPKPEYEKIVKDPYVMEFLQIQPDTHVYEGDSIVKYTLPEDNHQIFASKYFTYLPSEEELKRELNLKEFHKKE